MAMPQRDDPPSRCALRRTRKIEAIKRLDALLEYAVMHNDEAEAVLRDGARSVKGDTLLLVDPTEIRKEFSYKMEFVTRVRDASRSSKEGRDVLVNGYHGCMVARARAAIIGCSSLGGGSRRQNIATVIQTAYDLGGREMHLRRDAPAAKRSGWVSEANCEAAARPRAVRFPDERSEELCEAKSQEGARSPTRSSRWLRRESCPPRRNIPRAKRAP